MKNIFIMYAYISRSVTMSSHIGNKALEVWAIVIIVIGVLLVASIIVAVFCCCCRKRKNRGQVIATPEPNGTM